jgi:hypothetical protein
MMTRGSGISNISYYLHLRGNKESEIQYQAKVTNVRTRGTTPDLVTGYISFQCLPVVDKT